MLAHGLPVSLEGQLGARCSLCFPSKLESNYAGSLVLNK
uniref:Uncharacterized protein n=1 Tax=Populus trichocarpa TaxID=3694 RepID=A9P8R0_POPTR|nr:unknown [Populus trichocarpa]